MASSPPPLQPQPQQPSNSKSPVLQQPSQPRTQTHLSLHNINDVNVTSPAKVEDPVTKKSYAIFKVLTQWTPASTSEKQRIEVYHRFRDFESLNTTFSNPSFPPKEQFGKAFLEERRALLDGFMKSALKECLRLTDGSVSVTAEIKNKVSTFLKFLVHGEVTKLIAFAHSFKQLENKTIVDAPQGTALDHAIDLLRKEPVKEAVTTPAEDHKFLLEMCTKWSVTPSRFLWPKYVLTVFGTTSAGKSSLINHLCTVAVVGQCDVGYTLIETLPSADFRKYSDLPFQQFSQEQLRTPLPPTDLERTQDPRYGRVFFDFDAAATLVRYEDQFREVKEQLRTYGNLRSTIINEDYLFGNNPAEVEFAKHVIVIDTKGLDQIIKGVQFDQTMSEEQALQPFLAELKVRQLFLKISDLSLFLMGSQELHNCSAQIATYELSILFATEGEEFIKGKMKEAQEHRTDRSQQPQQQATGGLLYTLLFASPVDMAVNGYQMVKNIITAAQSGRKNESALMGNVRWSKTLFLITKVDLLYALKNEDEHSVEIEVFYELGRLFGTSLRHLEPPTFGQCMTIALPEHQKNLNPVTGRLPSFKGSLQQRASAHAYNQKRDEIIICLCDQILNAITNSYYSNALNPVQWWSKDQQRIEAIKQRTQERQRELVNA